jgi:hypothetical protein
LAAAGLLLRIIDFHAQAFEQFKCRDADFGIERVDKTGNEQGDFDRIEECGCDTKSLAGAVPAST